MVVLPVSTGSPMHPPAGCKKQHFKINCSESNRNCPDAAPALAAAVSPFIIDDPARPQAIESRKQGGSIGHHFVVAVKTEPPEARGLSAAYFQMCTRMPGTTAIISSRVPAGGGRVFRCGKNGRSPNGGDSKREVIAPRALASSAETPVFFQRRARGMADGAFQPTVQPAGNFEAVSALPALAKK